MNIAALVSGGVDSAVALSMLRDRGHRLTAFYLKIWLEDEVAFLGDCPWEQDLRSVRAVCAQLGVPLEVVPLQSAYHAQVVSYTLRELRAGRTPSPDVLCNRAIKFGAFVDTVGRDQWDAVASGHYARLAPAVAGSARTVGGGRQLLRGVDPVKDQSYFLAYLRREQLQTALFPLGQLHKRQVRAEAARRRLAPAARPDSQGICFLGNVSYRAFVRAYLGERPGTIVEHGSGRIVGRHRGHWFHTIGQRQGLGLGDGPWYVVAKDPASNLIEVSHDPLRCAVDRLELAACNWLAVAVTPGPVEVRIRHGAEVLAAELQAVDCGARPSATVRLARPIAGVAPGQFAVLYRGQQCLGAGAIATGDSRRTVAAAVPSVAHGEGAAANAAAGPLASAATAPV